MNSGNIGERLRAARKEMGLTQTELAERLGISFVGVSQWESGKRNPKKETLVRLAAILDVPVSYFLDTENLDDEALDFLLRAWKHADYQLTALQHNGSPPAENERWEHVCDELHTLYEEIAAKYQTKQETLQDRTTEIVKIFRRLNSRGQQKILEIAGDYAKIADYLQNEKE